MIGDLENHGFMRKIDSLMGNETRWGWFFHNIHIIHRMSSGKKALFSFSSGYDILSANISRTEKGKMQQGVVKMSMNWKDRWSIGATMVADAFIDEYMAGANGEYVKVYLYILRHQGEELTVESIADALDHTESDVRRAVSYWENWGFFPGQKMRKSRKGSFLGLRIRLLPAQRLRRKRLPAQTVLQCILRLR